MQDELLISVFAQMALSIDDAISNGGLVVPLQGRRGASIRFDVTVPTETKRLHKEGALATGVGCGVWGVGGVVED